MVSDFFKKKPIPPPPAAPTEKAEAEEAAAPKEDVSRPPAPRIMPQPVPPAAKIERSAVFVSLDRYNQIKADVEFLKDEIQALKDALADLKDNRNVGVSILNDTASRLQEVDKKIEGLIKVLRA